MAESHILERFRKITDDYNTGKIGRDEARNLMLEYARDSGKDDGTAGMQNLASTARLDLIIDQNAKMAHAVGEHERMYSESAMRVFPYVIYHASVGSKQPRDEHMKYDGMIFEKTDPWLRTHTPPWEFGCNCKLEQITAKRAGKTPTMIRPPTPPEKVHVESKSGYTFDPETVFKEFDFELIKNDVVRKEAKAGVGKILDEKHPEYKNIDYRPDKKPTEELHVGMNAVGSVWKKTELKKIPVEFMQSTKKNLAGETNIDGSGRVTSMKVYSNSVHPALSLVHETGHVIDYVFLRTLKKQEAKQKLLNVLRSSEGYQKMQQELDQLRNHGKLSKSKRILLDRLEYDMTDDEVLVRGFMQYIAEQNSGLLLEEFQKDAKLRPDLYLNTGEKKLKIQFQKCFAGLLKGIF